MKRLIAMFAIIGALTYIVTAHENLIGRICNLIGCLLATGLFYTMGSVAILFALSILLFDILQKSERWYASFIPLILLLIVGSSMRSR